MMGCIALFFKQDTAYDLASCVVGSGICIRDRGSANGADRRHILPDDKRHDWSLAYDPPPRTAADAWW